ncbi:hypothetical protein DL546_001004 [Coniochaeta pulveracea]|uniref:Uncharacterized protein n=1 Tax=Coniochaeta pulveracea TaxID=177199 RepID=A0A420Y1J7_9PEZI|nr:hypothetical protein DL546_001004 [Coniochaeta pulveracea]
MVKAMWAARDNGLNLSNVGFGFKIKEKDGDLMYRDRHKLDETKGELSTPGFSILIGIKTLAEQSGLVECVAAQSHMAGNGMLLSNQAPARRISYITYGQPINKLCHGVLSNLRR